MVGGRSLHRACDIGSQLWIFYLDLLFHSVLQDLKLQIQLLIDLGFSPE